MRAGDVFAGRYAIELEAGQGAAGIVYRAIDRKGGRLVALKVLRGVDADPDAVRRFVAEAGALERLDHPAIVRYVGHGFSERGEPFLAMEWIEGESLGARLVGNPPGMDIREVVVLGHRLAGALTAVHASGIVHRDVKPSNILLAFGRAGEAKLTDFGVARDERATHSTTSGTILGTIGYLSPEQASGDRKLDGRADLFSLGCVLFRCLTNREPFEGDDALTVIAKVLLGRAPRVSELRADVPKALDALIARMLAKDPDARPASAHEVQRELARIGARIGLGLSTGTAPARWRRPFAIGIALAAGLAIIAPFQLAAKPPRPPPSSLEAPNPACTLEAAELYEQGVQEVHDSREGHGRRLFERATELDPSCAPAHLQLVVTGETSASPVHPRERLRRTLALRDRLGERDRLVLDAWTALVGPSAPNHEEALRILDDAVRGYPHDAELLMRAGLRKSYAATDRAAYEAALELERRATFIDPTFAAAWQVQGIILGYMGRTEEKLRALDRCLEASPQSTDCIDGRMLVLKRLGRCEESVAESRRELGLGVQESNLYWHFATNLASVGASRPEIEEALTQRWNRLPAEKREWMILSERVRVAAWMGEFETALHAVDQLAHIAATTSDIDAHLRLAVVSSGLLLELGRSTDASLAARRFLQRRNVWVKGLGRVVGTSYYDPLLIATQLEDGSLTPSGWHKTMDEWEEANRTRLNDFQRWVMRWGTAIGPRIGATEAIAREPHGDPAVRSSSEFARLIGVMDGYEGRIRLLAGDARAAAPLLESSARSCNSLDFPFLNVQAHLWLGMAREQLGEISAACEAYRFVIDRWGNGKLRSKSAEEAKQRRHRLGC
ncbi:serine/threonine-protein kinase [Pendulispora brunnea]|uniref:Serine/threonine-protein kinase n=1 Tax=Pendulispora brunnea TaxID=2905690 RepID=A0ABZ2JXR2_9BACT